MWNDLIAAGTAPVTAVESIVSALSGSGSIAAKEKPILVEIIANYKSPLTVQDLVNKALEVPGLTSTDQDAINALPALCAMAAADQTKVGQMMSTIAGLENAL
jgi:hypothetical protein